MSDEQVTINESTITTKQATNTERIFEAVKMDEGDPKRIDWTLELTQSLENGILTDVTIDLKTCGNRYHLNLEPEQMQTLLALIKQSEAKG